MIMYTSNSVYGLSAGIKNLTHVHEQGTHDDTLFGQACQLMMLLRLRRKNERIHLNNK